MKVSKQKMAEHREQIIEAAAKRFREKGFDGISVAELMKEVGLTHGGFYGHFTSKEELVSLRKLESICDGCPFYTHQSPTQHGLGGAFISYQHPRS